MRQAIVSYDKDNPNLYKNHSNNLIFPLLFSLSFPFILQSSYYPQSHHFYHLSKQIFKIYKMQLSHSQPVWYFVFGGSSKTSLAAQYALEHGLQHLVNPSETTLKEHERKSLLIEASVEFFRSVEKWKDELVAVFLKGELSQQEKTLHREYELIGKARLVAQPTYFAFRKELYPELMIVYGPSQVLITSLIRDYFAFTGFKHIPDTLNANQILALPKTQNYLLTGFIPDPSELTVLQGYLHLQIVHLRHNRTELPQREEWFDRQALITPHIQKKSYYRAVSGYINDIIEQVGVSFLPQMIYANLHEKEEREVVRKYVEATDGLLLNVFEMQEVLRRKPNKALADTDKVLLLVRVLFQNIKRTEVVLTDFPWTPQEFSLLQTHTRRFKLFADFVKAEHYQFSKTLNASIYFLQTLRRKQIDLHLPFDSQIKTNHKYLLIAGAACSGKTAAARFIAAEMGYKHIECQTYLAAIKEKLLAPEDGEELPFKKIISHFAAQIANSGNTPLLIDGLPLDAKEIQNWTKVVGAATVLNLKVEERELIRRTRRKAEADLAAEVSEEELAKAKETIAKNNEWCDQLSAKSPLSTLFQIEFSQPLILGQELLRDILRPRVWLVQDNFTLLFQNLAIRHSFGFFNLYKHSLQDIANAVRLGSYRDVVICNYRQAQEDLICKDFYQIQRHIGSIRYLAVWGQEQVDSHDEPLHLEKPPVPQKPKLAEGEEEPPAAAEEEGEKKKVFNIYEHSWTKPGNQKNLSQWFFKQKRSPALHEHTLNDLSSRGLGFAIEHLNKGRDQHIYHRING